MADSTPPIPKTLIEWLERAWPNDVLNVGPTDRDVGIHIGRQQVIRNLRVAYNQQNKTQEKKD